MKRWRTRRQAWAAARSLSFNQFAAADLSRKK
jgi:hypothetical protein